MPAVLESGVRFHCWSSGEDVLACPKNTFVAAVVLAVAAALTGTGPAGAAEQDPVYTCKGVLVDDINRVASDDCTGGPAGYQGAGSIKDAEAGTVWECALLGAAADPERPARLTVVGVFGCEQSGGRVKP
ncbi:hypothetical protein [Streptomyces sp. NPDC102283]|uniref:hypothetical protein n=1 Tax=Streptomyces sp. NPDC102283 TaxID=3366155 RepID=UPI0038075113